LSALRTPEGAPVDIALTTNGSILARKAQALRAGGLRRTVSLDALDDAVFQRMNDVGFPVADVLAGIDAALAAGLAPVKLNMVVKRGTNDHEIVPMARYMRDRYGDQVRCASSSSWTWAPPTAGAWTRVPPPRCGPASRHWPLQPLQDGPAGETAERWRYADGRGEVGFISSVTHAFCGDCNRMRLSTEGRLFTCLFGSQGHDLRDLIRGGASDDALARGIRQIWGARQDRYSELRGTQQAPTAPRPGSRCTTSAADPPAPQRRPPIRPPVGQASARSLPGSPAWPLTQCQATSCCTTRLSSCCQSSTFFTGLLSAVRQPRRFQPWIQLVMPLRTYSLSV
jgi:cyclic pyranopterin phosphate synthase